ncbi:MAG: alanine--glyoxylate aminotransferase family protein, partial [Synergistaceae bacterium]|nr:alanine--glyoxylate aminotransferase family protein [Synergistaceae bacterium]
MNHYLLTPGPVASPTEVLRAQSKPLIGHRGARFSELFLGIENKLKQLLDTDQPIVVIPSSGTGALE